ncbi:hypothetical protein INR49_032651 [Caranx melampygus]|nr:hypothetical protein INR49_032651 [Caranx melampygus]
MKGRRKFFFLFLFTRFLRLLSDSSEPAVDFRFIKPGCEATTRFNLLAAAMLEDSGKKKHVTSSSALSGWSDGAACCTLSVSYNDFSFPFTFF